jgi:hypothetical protein
VNLETATTEEIERHAKSLRKQLTEAEHALRGRAEIDALDEIRDVLKLELSRAEGVQKPAAAEMSGSFIEDGDLYVYVPRIVRALRKELGAGGSPQVIRALRAFGFAQSSVSFRRPDGSSTSRSYWRAPTKEVAK